mgnify:CR=1 FL=1
MKIKFNLFERVAGLFVLGALGGAIAASISVAYKKGWFSSKVPLTVVFSSANGLHVGTRVQLAGLRAGSVTEVELQGDNQVRVRFEVLKKFHEKIKKDSVVQMVRPFIIGEKILDVSVGSPDLPPVDRDHELPVKSSMDMMDLLSGKELGTYMESMSQLTENLRALLDAFSDKKRFENLIATMDEIHPLVKNLNVMATQVSGLTNQLTDKKNVGRLVHNLALASDELKPHISTLAQTSPKFAKDLAVTIENMVLISQELKKTLPAIAEIAPDLPATSRRMIEAINEAVVTMKAVQKTFLIRGKVEEVKNEESKHRIPTNE